MTVADITRLLAPSLRAQSLPEHAHAVQFYDDETYLIDTVSEFVGSALRHGHTGVVIATRAHLDALEARWCAAGIDLELARKRDQYIALEAADTLRKLLLDGWPQERRFNAILEPVLSLAAQRHSSVRAFGEMVALLCAQGDHRAALRLEELWQALAARHPFALLCAYPMRDFATTSDTQSLLRICRQHTHVMPTESYTSIGDPRRRLHMITELQQKARALEREVREHRATGRTLAHHALDLRGATRRTDEFLATLAHELRNPLAPIRNAVEILRVADHDPVVAASARQLIERQVSHMVRLIDDLLDVSRITQDRLELRKERMDIATAVQLGVEISASQIESKQHRLTIHWPRTPLYVEADAARMAQVFANLLDNSAKYSRHRSSISVTLRKQGDRAVVEVIDTGCGIPAAMLPRIFDMFQRVDHGPGHVQDGLGIGLTLAKRVVELHGGHIDAHSEGTDLGSTFTVNLPLWGETADEQSPEQPRSGAQPAPRGPRRRILVVDDNLDSANSLATLLNLDGHEVRLAYDGLEALAIARQFHPEVAVLDIGMPRLNGYGVARELRAQVWGRGMRLIALTGWGQDEDRERAQDAGFDAHMVKPVTPELLRASLDEIPIRL